VSIREQIIQGQSVVSHSERFNRPGASAFIPAYLRESALESLSWADYRRLVGEMNSPTFPDGAPTPTNTNGDRH
jgi:hypothetical protein